MLLSNISIVSLEWRQFDFGLGIMCFFFLLFISILIYSFYLFIYSLTSHLNLVVEGEPLSLIFKNLLKQKTKSKKIGFYFSFNFRPCQPIENGLFFRKFRIFIRGKIQNHWTNHFNSQKNCLDWPNICCIYIKFVVLLCYYFLLFLLLCITQ